MGGVKWILVKGGDVAYLQSLTWWYEDKKGGVDLALYDRNRGPAMCRSRNVIIGRVALHTA